MKKNGNFLIDYSSEPNLSRCHNAKNPGSRIIFDTALDARA
jgi:hypothetical protein